MPRGCRQRLPVRITHRAFQLPTAQSRRSPGEPSGGPSRSQGRGPASSASSVQNALISPGIMPSTTGARGGKRAATPLTQSRCSVREAQADSPNPAPGLRPWNECSSQHPLRGDKSKGKAVLIMPPSRRWPPPSPAQVSVTVVSRGSPRSVLYTPAAAGLPPDTAPTPALPL